MKKLLQRTLKYFMSIILICLLVSSLAYFVFNKRDLAYSHVAINWSFYIITIFFCYATLAFVTEQGLFNGIRFSVKHVRATISKQHSYQMMEESNIKSKDELKEHIKTKYLYEKPKFDSTYPLLVSSTILFILGFVISFMLV